MQTCMFAPRERDFYFFHESLPDYHSLPGRLTRRMVDCLPGRQSTQQSTVYHSLPVDGRHFRPQTV